MTNRETSEETTADRAAHRPGGPTLEPAEERWLDDYLDRLRRAPEVDLQRVVVYGSKARGDAGPGRVELDALGLDVPWERQLRSESFEPVGQGSRVDAVVDLEGVGGLVRQFLGRALGVGAISDQYQDVEVALATGRPPTGPGSAPR